MRDLPFVGQAVFMLSTLFTEMIQTYSVAYQAALKSIEYLSAHVSEDRALIAASAPTSHVNRWLELIDKGQVLFCARSP